MRLSENDLFLLTQCAISAAYQAGQVIARHSQKPLNVQSKIAGDSLASQVVTEVDFLAEKVILQTLLPSCERFDLALLSEETVDDKQRLHKDFFWCIDPLDGTLPFIESSAGYAVSIALVSANGEPYIGVVYDPLSETLYHATKNFGVFKNSQPLKLKTPDENKPLTFIFDRSFQHQPLFAKVLIELEVIAQDLGYQGVDTLFQGGAVMNACWVLEKSPACYFKFPKPQQGGGCLWDYAATACLFNQVGLMAGDIYGQALDLNRAESSFMNHRGVLYSCHETIAKRVMDLYHSISRCLCGTNRE